MITFGSSAAVGLVAGWLLGRVHFGSLARMVRCALAGEARRAVALKIARLTLLAGGLAALAKLGAPALLCALAGLLLARTGVLRRAGGGT